MKREKKLMDFDLNFRLKMTECFFYFVEKAAHKQQIHT